MKRRLCSSGALLLVVAAALTLDRAFAAAWFSLALIALVLALGAVECRALLTLRAQRRAPAAAAAWLGGVGRAVLAALCVGLPGAFLLALRLREQGLALVLYLIAVAKMTDNGALLVGVLWGRHKLAPAISPAKTVEGVVGGLGAGVLTAVLLGSVCAGLGLPGSLLFGGVVSALAVLGDLTESWFKRQAGVKDSGALMPGIGGVLDLMDSVLLAAPAAYLLLSVA